MKNSVKKSLWGLYAFLIALALVVFCFFIASPLYFLAANKAVKTDVAEFAKSTNADYFTEIHGAIYIPTNAYNAWQTYRDFDESEIDRDLGYAQSIGLNALRVFTSYEYWLDEPEDFFAKFEKFVQIGQKHGIRLLVILFEDCGVDNTLESRTADTFETGFCVCSPERAVQKNRKRFSEVDGFVNEFMAKYANDDRLLAIEIMNEPHVISGNVAFSKYVLKKCRSFDGTVPLTMGQLTIFHNLLFPGMLDIYQYHDNFPNSVKRMETQVKLAGFLQKTTGRPFWLTEWQRVRLSGGGWGKAVIPDEEKVPDLASLAPVINKYRAGNFFWGLMVKPAYLPAQRPNGTFNGLFYSDGSVYSQNDKEAVTVR